MKEYKLYDMSLQPSVRRTGWSVTRGVNVPCRVMEKKSAMAKKTKKDVMVRI